MNLEVPLEAVGSVIAGRYHVEEVLGRGGMAVVYRVRDERSGRQLALKRGWSRDREKLQRNSALLEREYYTLAQLAHPRIIAVYDYGLDESGPYYTMELLDGADMESTGKLDWKQTCAVMRDVASSLAILHSRGLVHRDVSSRNVRYSSNGYVKLLDFGAMTSTGVAKDIVGTPRFMAPEMLVLQTLDARTDLFSLGALGYFLLTGRDAYPARRLSDLRDVWRSRPQPPARLVDDVPAPLSALIMRLLAIDRSGRPQSAAEVIEQLITIAGLPVEDAAEMSRAYLGTPTLVGREPELVELRRRILALVRGDGGVLMVQGPSGSGRSRVLDACSLEAKLLGAAVIRVDARDAASGDWGVARSIATQLLGQFPQKAVETLRLSREVLGHVIDELRDDQTSTATASNLDRSLLIRELRDFVLALARTQRLLLVVDDADRIDEPSTAWLAAVGHKTDRSPLLLVLASESGERAPTATSLRLLLTLAHVITLRELKPDDTEALLRSVFGDVPNLPLCAARIQRLAKGNPRATLELAQHLVDTGRARYEAGSWVLPAVLDEADLPKTLTDSLLSRLAELSPDAREVLDAVVLSDGDMLAIPEYRELTSHADNRRMFAALDELATARIVVLDGERCDLAQRSFLTVAQTAMDPESRKLIHGRLADLLAANGGDVLRRAHHLLAAGRDRQAVELLCSVDLMARLPPVELLATAIERADQLDVPAITKHRLHMALLVSAPFALASASFRRIAPLVLKRLDEDSGLAAYRQLEHVPAGERLSQALALTHQRYVETPERERVHSVIEATRELARVSGAIASMAGPVFDIELLEWLPDLHPLLPLSPALQVVAQLVDGGKDWVRGRYARAYFRYTDILTRIAEPDRGGLDEAQYDRIRLGLEYTLGLVEATQGILRAEQRAQLIESHREMRVNAWRIRAVMQLAQGNPDEARKSSRRAQLLHAQEGVRERYVGSTAGMELVGYGRLGDLLGVKSLLEPLATLAAQHPGWVAIELLGRAIYAHLQRDLDGALGLITAALDVAPPGRQPYFTAIASRQIDLLRELGRVDEASACARTFLRVCREHELGGIDVAVSAALAFTRSGAAGEALPLLDAMLDFAEKQGRTGLALGWLYEARARVALWMNDRAKFEEYLARCQDGYNADRYPAMRSVIARLVDEARQHNMMATEIAETIQHSFSPSTVESEYETIHSRIAECVDLPDRARCSLTLLLQSTTSSTGYLFGMREGRSLRLLAALPDGPSHELELWIAHYSRDTLDGEDVATGSGSVNSDGESTGSASGLAPLRFVDADGRTFEPAMLYDETKTGRVLVAALVIQIDVFHRQLPAPELRQKIARELVLHGDVQGWTRGD